MWYFDCYSNIFLLDYLDRESLAAFIEVLSLKEVYWSWSSSTTETSPSLLAKKRATRDGRLEASGHNWVEGQVSSIDKAA